MDSRVFPWDRESPVCYNEGKNERGEIMMKNALITGATGGIGEAIARKLGEMGYSLALFYGRNHEKAQALAAELSEITEVKTYAMDFRHPDKAHVAMGQALDDFGSFQLLVHGAGISVRGFFHELEDPDFEELLDINLRPLYYLTRKVIPDMIDRQEGQIISISSIWGSRAAAMEVGYAMTKGALEQFTRGLAAELSHMGIRVNAIAPGGVDTDILANLSEEEKQQFLEDIPFRRLCRPEEIADLVEFLLTKGTYITGQVITIDGGYTL